MLSESLGTKRGTRGRGKKKKAVEKNPVFFFLGGGEVEGEWTGCGGV